MVALLGDEQPHPPSRQLHPRRRLHVCQPADDNESPRVLASLRARPARPPAIAAHARLRAALCIRRNQASGWLVCRWPSVACQGPFLLLLATLTVSLQGDWRERPSMIWRHARWNALTLIARQSKMLTRSSPPPRGRIWPRDLGPVHPGGQLGVDRDSARSDARLDGILDNQTVLPVE